MAIQSWPSIATTASARSPPKAAMRLIAGAGTLAVWRRHKGAGPPYTISGNRILYLGSDLNAWLDERRVEPPYGEATLT